MANAGSVLAHFFKLTVTLICMRYLESPYSIFANEGGWSARAFQILLLHSVLGILTFGKKQKKQLIGKKEKERTDASPSTCLAPVTKYGV